MPNYKSRAAREAAQYGYGTASYWQYLDDHAQELAEKFPERAFYFMDRTLGETLAGNKSE